MTVAGNIRQHLESRGIMQNVVAAKAGMRTDSFSSAMHSKRKISIEEYIRICAALNEPVDRFIKPEPENAGQEGVAQ